MTNDELIDSLAHLLAGLQVPVSIGMKIGDAANHWRDLHNELIGFGWADKDRYAAALRERLVP